jgi:hypothetical protein
MAISRCRYWICVKCRSVHGKKDLEETIRRHRGRRAEEELTGHISCSKCGTRHSRADVYGGVYDAPEDRRAGDEELAEVELIDEKRSRDQEPTAEAITSEPRPRDRRRGEGRERDRARERDYERNDKVEETRDANDRQRHEGRSRRRDLGWVNVGLAIHYGGMIGFLFAIAAGWLAMFLLMIAVAKLSALPRDATPSASLLGTLAASGILFLVSNGLSGCASLTDFVSSVFCLRVPDGTARGFLIGALCARLVALPVGLALLFFVPYGWAVLASFVLSIIGWVLWVGFLCNLARILKQPILAQEALDVTFSAVKLGFFWMMSMAVLIGIIFLMVNARRVGGCFVGFFIATFIGATVGIIRYLVLTDRFGSLFNLALYPTGIPLVMRYLDLIGTLRTIILRRS